MATVAVEQVELDFPDQGPGGQPGRTVASRLDLGAACSGADVAMLDLGGDRPGWLPAPVPVLAGRAAAGQGAGVRLPAGRGAAQRVVAAVHGGRPGHRGDVELDWIGDAGTFPGHSGGPVIDAAGRALAGILVQGSEPGRFDRFMPVTLIARVWPRLPGPG